MADKKMTKREKFEHILAIPAVAADALAVETLTHEIELLEKKNSAERKPTKTQVENQGYEQAILDWMEPDTLYQVADITKGVPELVENDIKSQRVTPMLTNLVKNGKVARTEDKHKAYYSLA